MKKVFFFLIGTVWTATLFAQTCVSVKQVTTDYKKNKVTFSITWGDCKGDNSNHRNTVWVFVDYRDVGSSSWTRATISDKSAGTIVDSKGLWIYGASSTTQTITLDLDVPTNKYDWCAFATDYPPNIGTTTNGAIPLRGTPPFLINDSIPEPSKTYTGAVPISKLTDATGCPGIVCAGPNDPVGAAGCCMPGLTKVGGGTYGPSSNRYTTTAVCRDLDGDIASDYIDCGVELQRDASQWGGGWNNSVCKGEWRLPTQGEALCAVHAGVWSSGGALYQAATSDTACNSYCCGGGHCGVTMFTIGFAISAWTCCWGTVSWGTSYSISDGHGSWIIWCVR